MSFLCRVAPWTGPHSIAFFILSESDVYVQNYYYYSIIQFRLFLCNQCTTEVVILKHFTRKVISVRSYKHSNRLKSFSTQRIPVDSVESLTWGCVQNIQTHTTAIPHSEQPYIYSGEEKQPLKRKKPPADTGQKGSDVRVLSIFKEVKS